MPAANNLQDGNLADKQGPTGKRLPTCIHRTMSNPAMCIPHLQRKRNCDHHFSDLPAAASENLSKRRKTQMQPSTLSNFPSWSSFWVCNSEKSAPDWSKLVTSVRNQLQYCLLYTLPVLLQHKSFSSCTHLLKRWEDPKWMFTTEYYIIQILTTRLAKAFTMNRWVPCTHSSFRREGFIITHRFFPEKLCSC